MGHILAGFLQRKLGTSIKSIEHRQPAINHFAVKGPLAGTTIILTKNSFFSTGPNVTKLFTALIYKFS